MRGKLKAILLLLIILQIIALAFTCYAFNQMGHLAMMITTGDQNTRLLNEKVMVLRSDMLHLTNPKTIQERWIKMLDQMYQ